MLLYPEKPLQKPYKELHSKALQINTKAKWKIFQTYKAASTFEAINVIHHHINRLKKKNHMIYHLTQKEHLTKSSTSS